MSIIKYVATSSDVNNILKSYAKSIHSLQGEDGVFEKIFEILGTKNYCKWCVEFGAGDGEHLSNTNNLIMNQGWNGVLIEGDIVKYEKLEKTYKGVDRVSTFHSMVGFEKDNNIDSILEKTSIPTEFGLISIDIDGCDYHIWESIKKYRPTLVIIEFNGTIPNDIIFIQDRDLSLNHGSSLRAMIELGKLKGYELISVVGQNGLFVLKEYYGKFNIPDNDIQKMRRDPGKRIWQGYDGTIFTSNFSHLVWGTGHRPIDPEELQVIPKGERRFGGKIPIARQPHSTEQSQDADKTASLPAHLENIALNKPARQSSLSKWSRPHEAQNAVNGIKNGKFSFCTNKEPNPWWQVDLESSYELEEIRVYNRLDAGSQRTRTLKILISSDERSWEQVYSHARKMTFGGVFGAPLIVKLKSKVAQYVRLELDDDNYLHLDEVEVYGKQLSKETSTGELSDDSASNLSIQGETTS